jgi:hypothetical protein
MSVSIKGDFHVIVVIAGVGDANPVMCPAGSIRCRAATLSMPSLKALDGTTKVNRRCS